MVLRPVSSALTPEPGYPDRSRQRRFVGLLGLLGRVTITVPMCLALLLASPRPVAAADRASVRAAEASPRGIGMPTPVGAMQLAQAGQCRGRVAPPPPPPCTGDAEPPPCSGVALPPPCEGFEAPPNPPPCPGSVPPPQEPPPVTELPDPVGAHRLLTQLAADPRRHLGAQIELRGVLGRLPAVGGQAEEFYIYLNEPLDAQGRRYACRLSGLFAAVAEGQPVVVRGTLVEDRPLSRPGLDLVPLAASLQVSELRPGPTSP